MLAEGKVEIGTAGSVKAHVEQQVRHRCHKGLEVLTQDVKRNVMLMSFKFYLPSRIIWVAHSFSYISLLLFIGLN